MSRGDLSQLFSKGSTTQLREYTTKIPARATRNSVWPNCLVFRAPSPPTTVRLDAKLGQFTNMTEYKISTTTAGGRPRFVRSQSYSNARHHHLRDHFPHLHHDHGDGLQHHHLTDHLFPHDHYYRMEYRRGPHHHRPKCPSDCACVTREEYGNLLKQNRHYVVLTTSLQEDAKKFKKAIEAATCAQAAADKDNKRLLADNAGLAVSLKKLQDENAELRKCLATQKGGDSELIEALRRRIRDQLTELDSKSAFIRNLESRIDDLKKDIFTLKHRYKHRHDHHHHHHSSCRCHACSKKIDSKKPWKDEDGSSSSSSDDDKKTSSRKARFLKRIGELEVSSKLWQHKTEIAERAKVELQGQLDEARMEVLRQTEVADRFRRRVHKLEDRLGCRERGVWFG